MIQFILNDKTISTSLPPGMVMLDFIRYQQHLSGTKIGCREGDCGACTILVGSLVNDEMNYQSMTSCLMPIGNAAGKHIVSVEGINFSDKLNFIQQAMVDEGASQCGFCTPGFVVALTGFCLEGKNTNPINYIDGNICRCTGYKAIERAANKIAATMKERNTEPVTNFLFERKIIPEYFKNIKEQLYKLIHAQKTKQVKDPAGLQKRPHLVGGGTDLFVQKHEIMSNADIDFIIDKSNFKEIIKDGNKCFLGAAVTVSDLKLSPIINEAFPEFYKTAQLISSTPIRNMATIAGNFINASPIGDFSIFFLALDAHLILTDGIKKRELPLRKLYKGYKLLDKKSEEQIEKIWFNIPATTDYFHFEKVSKRTHLDIASVNTAIYLQMKAEIIETAGLSAGGVGPVPLFLQKTSDFLVGKKITPAVFNDAIAIMHTEISPISDARGSKEYKTLLLEQLIKAHFLACKLI